MFKFRMWPVLATGLLVLCAGSYAIADDDDDDDDDDDRISRWWGQYYGHDDDHDDDDDDDDDNDDVVDCDDGDSIQEELEDLDDDELLIEFTGTCVENIDISTSGVTLIGTDLFRRYNVIQGNITITGAIGVELSNFTVDGSSVGRQVAVQDGSFAVLTNMDLHLVHLTANRNSGVSLLGSTILAASGDQAMEAFRNSLIRIENTTVTGADGRAVQLGGHSYLHAVNSTLTTPNNDRVLPVLRIFESSGARFDGGTVTGVVDIQHRSTVTGNRRATFNGDVNLRTGSALINGFGQRIRVNGVLTCIDGESSAAGIDSRFGSNNCSGF